MYVVYYGLDGLKEIVENIYSLIFKLLIGLKQFGY